MPDIMAQKNVPVSIDTIKYQYAASMRDAHTWFAQGLEKHASIYFISAMHDLDRALDYAKMANGEIMMPYAEAYTCTFEGARIMFKNGDYKNALELAEFALNSIGKISGLPKGSSVPAAKLLFTSALKLVETGQATDNHLRNKYLHAAESMTLLYPSYFGTGERKRLNDAIISQTSRKLA